MEKRELHEKITDTALSFGGLVQALTHAFVEELETEKEEAFKGAMLLVLEASEAVRIQAAKEGATSVRDVLKEALRKQSEGEEWKSGFNDNS